MKERVFPREKYLSKIRPFYKSDIIKVITGIRRCGKSYILKAIINELLADGVEPSRIIYVPLDRRGFKDIDSVAKLEARIESFIVDNGDYFIFIDEVQNVKGFERLILSYQEEGYSVFITGSNSYLLSEEISTKLTGRYLKFETFTLDFLEYLDMKRFFGITVGTTEDEFMTYMVEGGFPKALEFPDAGARHLYTKTIIREIFEKDVKKRKKIRNILLFERVQSYLINNYAASFSIANLYDELKRQGVNVKQTTLRNYINELQKAKIVYECNRFDLKTKKSLKREQKYYLADLSIFFAMNTDNRVSFGAALENLVFLYLKSNGYEISIGRIGNFECDFIARNIDGGYLYIQVAYTLQSADRDSTDKLKEREYRPFRTIRDGYPRYIISLDRLRDQQEGVLHINAIDLFLGKAKFR